MLTPNKTSEAPMIGEEEVARALEGSLPWSAPKYWQQQARAAISAHLEALWNAGLVVVPRVMEAERITEDGTFKSALLRRMTEIVQGERQEDGTP